MRRLIVTGVATVGVATALSLSGCDSATETPSASTAATASASPPTFLFSQKEQPGITGPDRELASQAVLSDPVFGPLLSSGQATLFDITTWWSGDSTTPVNAQERAGVVVSLVFAEPVDLPAEVPEFIAVDGPGTSEGTDVVVGEDGLAETQPQPGRPDVRAVVLFIRLPQQDVYAASVTDPQATTF